VDKQAVIARIEEIGKAIEQSLAQHNALVGRLNEAQYILQSMEAFEKDLKEKNVPGIVGDVINVGEEIVSEGSKSELTPNQEYQLKNP
jgi:hypothetical protein